MTKDEKKPLIVKRGKYQHLGLVLLVASLVGIIITVAVLASAMEETEIATSEPLKDEGDSANYFEHDGERYYGGTMGDERVENFTFRKATVVNGSVIEKETYNQVYYTKVNYYPQQIYFLAIALILLAVAALLFSMVWDMRGSKVRDEYERKGKAGDVLYEETTRNKKAEPMWVKSVLVPPKDVPDEGTKTR